MQGHPTISLKTKVGEKSIFHHATMFMKTSFLYFNTHDVNENTSS